jgi:two-component system chemotaxis response regulator CheY
MRNLEGLRILVVDDEPFMRRTIRAVLRAIDHFDVEEAPDGDLALDLVAVFRPDVVLCDIAMPRMGGLQFVARLREHPVEELRLIPVMILTGQADETTVRGAARLRIDGFVVKPVSPKLLRAHLHNIFARRKVLPPA